MNGARWKRLSTAARRRQPWCLDCGAVEDLTVDHIISIDEDRSLAYEPLNFAVRCRPCNSSRGATGCTDTERQAVHDAIKARGGTPSKREFRRGVKAQGALLSLPGGLHCGPAGSANMTGES